MKRSDVTAGILGGTIFVVGCTVGIFGFKKLHEPLFIEASPKAIEQTEQHEESTKNNIDYPIPDEVNDYISVAESEDAGKAYVTRQAEPTPVQQPVEAENVEQVTNEVPEVIADDPNLTIIEANFNKYDIPEQQNTSDQFVLNTSTLKIHHPDCKDVRKIKPENYSTSNLSIDELRDQGYTTCGHCFE